MAVDGQLRHEDGTPACLGFFAAGEPRNVIATLCGLVEDKLRRPAGVGMCDAGVALLERNPDAYMRAEERLRKNPLHVEAHVNDINTPTLARAIVLLVIAAEHARTFPPTLSIDTTYLYLSVSGHLVLYASQRRALDAVLSGLIATSASLSDFERGYPWLRVRGDGTAGSDAALLRELRWIWLRWYASRIKPEEDAFSSSRRRCRVLQPPL